MTSSFLVRNIFGSNPSTPGTLADPETKRMQPGTMTQETTAPESPTIRPLRRRRILFCGKGGSGKSTLAALMADVLQRKGYEVMVLDGDASNPEGLVRLLFGVGVQEEPKPLIEFFGGIDRVTCPVDDPRPLTRIGDTDPITSRRIRLSEEIGPEYYLQRGRLRLLQAGKIETYGQGCDGPLEKVVRDFMVEDDCVSLIDEKAGVEHFGRRIPDLMDIILAVLDCTRESVSIARRITGFADTIGRDNIWLMLNKVESGEMADRMMRLLGDLAGRVIGSIPYQPDLVSAALAGRSLEGHPAFQAVEPIVHRLEHIASQVDPRPSDRIG
jgi:CO dehydrogenase maturation factor